MDRDARPTNAPSAPRDSYSYRGGPIPSPTTDSLPRFGQPIEQRMRESREPPKQAPKRKRKLPVVPVVRFALPPKTAPPEQNSESDDDEDMADYFAIEIAKTEAELSKLEKPKLPTQIMARFAALSHGAMVKIVSEGEGLMKMVEDLPEAVNQPVVEKIEEPAPVEQQPEQDTEMTDAVVTSKATPEPPVQPGHEPEAPASVEKPEEPPVETVDIPMAESEPTPLAPEPAKEPIEKPVEKPIEQPSERPSEQLEEKPSEKAIEEEPAEKPDEMVIEKTTETTAEATVEKPVDKTTEEPREEVPEQPMKEPTPPAPASAPAPEPEVQPEPQPEPEPKMEDTTKPTVEMAPAAPETTLPTVEEAAKEAKEDEATKPAEVPAPEPEKPSETPRGEQVEVTAEKPMDSKPSEPLVEKAVEPQLQKPSDEVAENPSETPIEKPETTSNEHLAAEPVSMAVPSPNAVLQTTETGSKPPSTPSQVDDDETESEDDSFMNISAIRQSMSTPPIDSLPDFGCQPWHEDREFMRSLDSDPGIYDFVMEHLDRLHLEKTAEQERDRKIYADNYVRYLDFTASNDPAAVKSRGKFSTSTAEGTGAVTPEPKHEGSGRGRRFATERDLERVLQASMREDEERKERELRMQQEKYRTDKDAVIPDMIWTQEEKDNVKYLDHSGFTPVDRLVASWRVLPPVNNFSEEEAGLFEKRYLEAPKQWGRVADGIPHRDFSACIQYYYMNKKDLNLKEKLKKQPRRRKKGGRGKQRSSALVSELGNGEGETEENHETGENGERRRPRRAAAPTWGFEQPAVDTDNSTPSATPGRRGASAKGDHPEKVDGRKRGRKAKDKDAKAHKTNQTLAAAPAPGKGRSRSNSRALNTETQPPAPAEVHRLPTQFEQQPSGIQPPFPVQQQQPMQTMDRPQPIAAPSSISEVMAAPSLRPEPPPQPAITTFNLAQPQPERKAPTQASSYWSVSESNDFPHLLRSFGSDWTGIAAHMGSKTAVMVSSHMFESHLVILIFEIGQKLLCPPKGSRQG